MSTSIEIPPCPRCGSPYAVRILTPAHAVELANPKKVGSNPFDFFTSNYTNQRSPTAGADLAGGCLLAIVGILTSPLQARHQKRKDAVESENRDKQRQAYKKIIDECPTLYTCGREGIVFIPGHSREIPTKQVLTLLSQNVTTDELLVIFK